MLKPLFLMQPRLAYRQVPSIRVVLAWLVVGCVVPMAMVAASLIYIDYANDRQQAALNAISRARALAATLDREFSALQAGLQVMTTTPALENDDLRSFYQNARDSLRHLNANNCVLIDPGGRQILNTLLPYGSPLPKTSPTSELLNVFRTGSTVITNLFTGPVTKQPIFAMAVPVLKNDRMVYSLNAGVYPERIAGMLQRERLPPDWVTVVIDGTGTIVASTHAMDRFVGQKANPQLVTAADSAPEGSFETVSFEGVPVLTAFSHSRLSQWTVAVGIPVQSLSTGLRSTVAALVAMTLAILSLGLAFAWLVGGKITHSIMALLEPAKALAEGAQLHIAPQYFREANEFGDSLVEAERTLRRARHAAHHDVLTGLANRLMFDECVNLQLAICRRTRTTLCVLYIDLDGFKAVNDSLGHAKGDALLCAVAQRIKTSCRTSDLAARLGGDEFAIALNHSDLENASAFATKLIEALSAPYLLGEQTVGTVSASIGIAGYPDTAMDAHALLKAADKAMFEAKVQGKRRYVVSRPAK